MKSKTSLEWAIGQMDFQPHDTVLEIGPGKGRSLLLIGNQLTNGSLLGVERSLSAIASAKALLRQSGSRQIKLLKGDIITIHLGNRTFSKIFAHNVGVFVDAKSDVFARIMAHLQPGGSIGIFYQNPPDSAMTKLNIMLRQVQAQCTRNGLVIRRQLIMPDASAPAGGVIADLRSSSSEAEG